MLFHEALVKIRSMIKAGYTNRQIQRRIMALGCNIDGRTIAGERKGIGHRILKPYLV